jgi:ATP synthase protein I
MKTNSPQDPEKKPPNTALKYTGIGFQMLAIIGLGVFGGIKLDQWLHTDNVFTIILSLLSITSAIYIVIKDFIKPKKK